MGGEGGETLAQAARRSCRCPKPGGVQGQVRWGLSQAFIPNGWNPKQITISVHHNKVKNEIHLQTRQQENFHLLQLRS